MALRQQATTRNRRRVTRNVVDRPGDVIIDVEWYNSTELHLTTPDTSIVWQPTGILPVWCAELAAFPVAMGTAPGLITLGYASPLVRPFNVELAPNSPQLRTKWGQYVAPFRVLVDLPASAIPRVSWTVTDMGGGVVALDLGGGIVAVSSVPAPAFMHVQTGNLPTVVGIAVSIITLQYAAAVPAGDSIVFPDGNADAWHPSGALPEATTKIVA